MVQVLENAHGDLTVKTFDRVVRHNLFIYWTGKGKSKMTAEIDDKTGKENGDGLKAKTRREVGPNWL